MKTYLREGDRGKGREREGGKEREREEEREREREREREGERGRERERKGERWRERERKGERGREREGERFDLNVGQIVSMKFTQNMETCDQNQPLNSSFNHFYVYLKKQLFLYLLNE